MDPKIIKTRDFNIFKKSPLNRNVDENHVNKIKEELKRENYLHLKPIIVNSNMEVISGQHRLQAAKELGMDIFYIKDDNVSDQFILTDNSTQKTTSLKDVINFWALKDKKQDYIKLLKYMEQTHLAPKAFLNLIFPSGDSRMSPLLRRGVFILPKDLTTVDKIIDSYCRIKDYFHEKRVTPFSIFSSFQFCTAWRTLMVYPDFDLEILFKKLDQKWFEIKPQVNSKGWLTLLVSIYNFRNQDPIAIDSLI